MPSQIHDTIAQLFARRPEALRELLAELQPLLPAAPARVEAISADATEAHPAARTADLVLRFDGEPPVIVVVEVQLRADPNKGFTWPAYLANLRDRHRAPALLVVVCPSRRVAEWAAAPIDTGHPGWALRPLVIGPDQLPRVDEPAGAWLTGETAVLSVLFHAGAPEAATMARPALEALRALDEPARRTYLDLVLRLASDALRRALEAHLQQVQEFQSAFMRRVVGEAREEGREEGREQGREEARQQLLQLLQRGLGDRFPRADWSAELQLAAAAPIAVLADALATALPAADARACRARLRRLLGPAEAR